MSAFDSVVAARERGGHRRRNTRQHVEGKQHGDGTGRGCDRDAWREARERIPVPPADRVAQRPQRGTYRREDDRDIGSAGYVARCGDTRGTANRGANCEGEQQTHGSIALRQAFVTGGGAQCAIR